MGRLVIWLLAGIASVALTVMMFFPAAWMAVDKWLQNYPYRITINWTMFAIPGLLVILIALFTISFQSIKTALANPVKSLRTE